jgi:hypothetical protein
MRVSERARKTISWSAPLLALAAVGCQDSRAMIYIQQVSQPVAGGSGSGCKIDATPTNPFISRGTLDLAFGRPYAATFLVGNQLIARGDRIRSRAESDRVDLQGAEVRIEDANGNEVRGFRSVPGAGSIDPGTDTAPSFGLLDTVLLDGNFLGAYVGPVSTTGSKTFITYSRAYGTTTGGTFVESGEFPFPIDVCWGCLIAFPPDADDPTGATQPNCDNVSSTTTSTATCSIGQDTAIDCRVCKGAIISANQQLCDHPQ